MIHKLRDMIGSANTSAPLHDATGTQIYWVRSVPEPLHGGLLDRLSDAWAVIRGSAFAVRWPTEGELEDALGGEKRMIRKLPPQLVPQYRGKEAAPDRSEADA